MAGEHDILPQCLEKWKAVEGHLAESPHFRSIVDKGEEQILTLNRAHAITMEDIKDIKKCLSDIKIWILTSAVAGLIILLGEAIYFGGQMKQLEINTDEIHELRDIVRPKPVTFKMGE